MAGVEVALSVLRAPGGPSSPAQGPASAGSGRKAGSLAHTATAAERFSNIKAEALRHSAPGAAEQHAGLLPSSRSPQLTSSRQQQQQQAQQQRQAPPAGPGPARGRQWCGSPGRAKHSSALFVPPTSLQPSSPTAALLAEPLAGSTRTYRCARAAGRQAGPPPLPPADTEVPELCW
jgi:hypothetical protein